MSYEELHVIYMFIMLLGQWVEPDSWGMPQGRILFGPTTILRISEDHSAPGPTLAMFLKGWPHLLMSRWTRSPRGCGLVLPS